LKSIPPRLLALGILLVGMTTACVYFNAMYDAGNAYDAGLDDLQEGQGASARLQFDSVIAKTDRILRKQAMAEIADREVTIMGDRELPYRLLKRVMASCTAADYGRISLAVMQRAPDPQTVAAVVQ